MTGCEIKKKTLKIWIVSKKIKDSWKDQKEMTALNLIAGDMEKPQQQKSIISGSSDNIAGESNLPAED